MGASCQSLSKGKVFFILKELKIESHFFRLMLFNHDLENKREKQNFKENIPITIH